MVGSASTKPCRPSSNSSGNLLPSEVGRANNGSRSVRPPQHELRRPKCVLESVWKHWNRHALIWQGCRPKKKDDEHRNDVTPVGGSTPVGVIDKVRRLVMTAGSSLRSVPRIFEIFQADQDPLAHLPSASGARWWLLRMGLYALREPLVRAADWVYIIDHSIQIGTLKLCLILGVRLSELPAPSRPLRHSDMRLLALIPTEQSNGRIVLRQLEKTAKRTGIPREIVSDHGSDVKSGGELFVAEHPETALVYDVAHYGAILLKRLFQADDRWARFIAQLGQTKSHLQQTSDAFLMSPGLRPKARYMNLESLFRWSLKILELLARGTAGGLVTERTKARYGWMEEFRGVLGEWSRWEDTVRSSLEFIRIHGFSRNCEVELAAHLGERPSAMRHRRMEAELITFARSQSASVRPGERLVGSSEVEESVFGKLKVLEGDQSRSGFTRYVLSLGALVGDWTPTRIKKALEATPVKMVQAWCDEHLPLSVQAQRRLAFSAIKP